MRRLLFWKLLIQSKKYSKKQELESKWTTQNCAHLDGNSTIMR
jgi:hypothetical protein